MKKKVLGIGLVVLLIAVLAFVFIKFSDKPVEGSKSVTLEVVNSKSETTTYEIKTDAMYLAEVMDEIEDLEYVTEEGPYGLTLIAVNGEEADFNTSGAYWSIYVNDEYASYGISEQPVEDGDVFGLVYTVQ